MTSSGTGPAHRRQEPSARRPAARPRNARPRSRTTRPCRSSRHPGRSPRRPGSRGACVSIGPTPTSERWWQCALQQDRAGGRTSSRARLPASPAAIGASNSSNVRQAPATDSARARSSPLQESGIVVADRQDAARLAGDDRPPLARPFVEELDVVAGVGHGLRRASRWRSAAGRSSAGPGARA